MSDDRSLEEIIPPEGKATEQVNLEIADLEKAREIISRPTSTPEVLEAKIENPLENVEIAMAKYISTKAEMDLAKNEFSKLIMEKVADRLDTMNTEQLLGLFGTDRVTGTDAMSKFLGPTSQIITAKQQAKIAAETRQAALAEKAAGNGNVQIAIGNVGAGGAAAAEAANAQASQQALQGMTILYQLMAAIDKGKEKQDTTLVNAKVEDVKE